jgi:hypothetical protein
LEPSNVTLNGMVPIAGMAFAGGRGIAKVEVQMVVLVGNMPKSKNHYHNIRGFYGMLNWI